MDASLRPFDALRSLLDPPRPHPRRLGRPRCIHPGAGGLRARRRGRAAADLVPGHPPVVLLRRENRPAVHGSRRGHQPHGRRTRRAGWYAERRGLVRRRRRPDHRHAPRAARPAAPDLGRRAGASAGKSDHDPAGGWGGLGASGGNGNAAKDYLRTSAAGGGATTVQLADSDGSNATTVAVAAGSGGDAGPAVTSSASARAASAAAPGPIRRPGGQDRTALAGRPQT